MRRVCDGLFAERKRVQFQNVFVKVNFVVDRLALALQLTHGPVSYVKRRVFNTWVDSAENLGDKQCVNGSDTVAQMELGYRRWHSD